MGGSRGSAVEAPKVDLREAKLGFDLRSALFVDVRRGSEYERSHIPGALSLPIKEVFRRCEELPRDRSIIFYCT